MEEEVMVQRLCVGEIAENCYIVTRKGRNDSLIIDPGDEAERIRSALGTRRLTAILLTHGHFDHIGAVGALMEEETELWIHPMDAAMLADPALNCSWLLGPPVTAPEAGRFFSDGQKLMLAGCVIEVIHTPGHTPGGCCFALGEHLFTGDTLMRGGIGRTDLPGGNERQLMESLRKLKPWLDGRRIWGGHG